MMGERSLFHRLLDFELNGFLIWLGGNSFIEISGHRLGLDKEEIWGEGIRDTKEASG